MVYKDPKCKIRGVTLRARNDTTKTSVCEIARSINASVSPVPHSLGTLSTMACLIGIHRSPSLTPLDLQWGCKTS